MVWAAVHLAGSRAEPASGNPRRLTTSYTCQQSALAGNRAVNGLNGTNPWLLLLRIPCPYHIFPGVDQ